MMLAVLAVYVVVAAWIVHSLTEGQPAPSREAHALALLTGVTWPVTTPIAAVLLALFFWRRPRRLDAPVRTDEPSFNIRASGGQVAVGHHNVQHQTVKL